MKRLCEVYVKHIRIFGALMCIIPFSMVSLVLMTQTPFREVYLLRLALGIVFGGLAGALGNEYMVQNFFFRVTRKDYALGITHGCVGGFLAGTMTAWFPPLTLFISSTDVEQAKTILIVSWLGAGLLGVVVGGVFGWFGVRYLVGEPPGAPAGTQA